MIDNTKEEKDEIEILLEEFVQNESDNAASGSQTPKPEKKTEEKKVSKPPRIEKIRVAHTEYTGPYTKGEISISFTCSEAVDRKDIFDAYIYHSSLFLIGSGNSICQYRRANGRTVKIYVFSAYIWMPGSYFIVLSQNDEPFYQINVEVGAEAEFACTGEELPKNSPHYLLVKYLERGDDYFIHWFSLREQAGLRSLKERLLECCQKDAMDKLRDEYGMLPVERNKNYLFMDKETDKTEFVLRYFSYIACKAALKYTNAGDLMEQKFPSDTYDTLSRTFGDSSDGDVLCLTHVGLLLSGNNASVLSKMEEFLSKKNRPMFILGAESEIELLFETVPSIRDYFPAENRVQLLDYGAAEVVYELQQVLQNHSLYLSLEAEQAVANRVLQMERDGALMKWNGKNVERFVSEAIFPRFNQRMLKESSSLPEGKVSYALSSVRPEDIDWDKAGNAQASFDESVRTLHGMVGLNNLKQRLQTTFNRMKFDRLRRQMGYSVAEESCHHMIFTGNPGTGKTTVAKMIGKIYHSLGILSKGDVIVTERSRIVGNYIGETERNMVAILEKARGNVLFIDEAYTLCDSRNDRKDFGHRAIECLLTVLAQKNPDMLVILAGYEDEMERMMDVNQGLKGRFPNKFHFDDYSADELMEIGRNLLAREDYVLTDEADKRLYETVCETVSLKDRHFSNARWMEQYICHGIIPALADRIVNSPALPDRAACQTIKPVDIETAYRHFRLREAPVVREHRKIGFRA